MSTSVASLEEAELGLELGFERRSGLGSNPNGTP